MGQNTFICFVVQARKRTGTNITEYLLRVRYYARHCIYTICHTSKQGDHLHSKNKHLSVYSHLSKLKTISSKTKPYYLLVCFFYIVYLPLCPFLAWTLICLTQKIFNNQSLIFFISLQNSILAGLAVDPWEQNDPFEHLHVKITFSSAVNKTQAFLPSDPASQVYILRTRNIWVKREGGDPQCSNPTKCLLKDKMRESRRNSQSLLQKKNSLMEWWKNLEQRFPWGWKCCWPQGSSEPTVLLEWMWVPSSAPAKSGISPPRFWRQTRGKLNLLEIWGAKESPCGCN